MITNLLVRFCVLDLVSIKSDRTKRHFFLFREYFFIFLLHFSPQHLPGLNSQKNRIFIEILDHEKSLITPSFGREVKPLVPAHVLMSQICRVQVESSHLSLIHISEPTRLGMISY